MSRDTQFAGFAALLASDIRDKIRQLYAEFGIEPDSLVMLNIHKIEPIIAHRAYDFMQHTVGYSLEYLHECGHNTSGSMNSRIAAAVPDITTWPEE